jgi:glutathione S-transferase
MQIPNSYGYVVLAVGAMAIPNVVALVQVIKARKKYGVKYPDLYAPDGHKNKKEFDCVQRAHQNTLEVAPSVASCTMMVGLMHPITSAALCGIWSLGRVVYVLGYGTGNPANRRTGGLIAHLGDIPLFVMTFVVGYKMLQ